MVQGINSCYSLATQITLFRGLIHCWCWFFQGISWNSKTPRRERKQERKQERKELLLLNWKKTKTKTSCNHLCSLGFPCNLAKAEKVQTNHETLSAFSSLFEGNTYILAHSFWCVSKESWSSRWNSPAWSGALDEDDPHTVSHLVCEAHRSINKGSTLLPKRDRDDRLLHSLQKSTRERTLSETPSHFFTAISVRMTHTISCLWALIQYFHSSLFRQSEWRETDMWRDMTVAKYVGTQTHHTNPLLSFYRGEFQKQHLLTWLWSSSWRTNWLPGLMILMLRHTLIHSSYHRSSVNSPVPGCLSLMWHFRNKCTTVCL